MADAVAEGAGEAGAQVSVFAPDEANEEDLVAADALILGSGVHMGGMESSMSAFFERMAPLWLQGKMVGKLGGAFTRPLRRRVHPPLACGFPPIKGGEPRRP
jgi:NAD(P)H dehydrogenase (quinone)